MDNFTPLHSEKTKKFNKFLIIGNLLLVVLVSVTGLVYYNKTLLTTQQKAAKPGLSKSWDDMSVAERKAYQQEVKDYQESGQADADKEAKKKKEREEKKAREEEVNAGSGCPGGFQNTGVEDSRGNIRHICCDMSSSDACYRQAANMGIDVKVTSQGGSGSGGYRCIVGREGYTGKEPCTANNDVQDLGAGKPPSCFCGTIQVDGGEWNGTYTSSCGCNEQEKQAVSTALVGTIIPTPTDAATPTPTATPTEIILAKTSISPTTVGKLLETGVVKSFVYLIPAAIMLIGLIL